MPTDSRRVRRGWSISRGRSKDFGMPPIAQTLMENEKTGGLRGGTEPEHIARELTQDEWSDVNPRPATAPDLRPQQLCRGSLPLKVRGGRR